MPTYEYVSCADLKDEDGKYVGEGNLLLEVMKPMSQSDAVDAIVPCPIDGFVGHMRRVHSIPNFFVAGARFDWKERQRVVTKGANGEDLAFSFVDHKHTDPQHQRNLAALAQKQGIGSAGLGNARYSPEHGRVVVDVMSSMPDPLGALSKSDASGRTNRKKTMVNQEFKTRAKKPKKRPSNQAGKVIPRRTKRS